MVLAVILKENYLLDPCVVSSNPLCGGSVFLGQNLREGERPPGRETPMRGSTRKQSGALDAEEPPSPSTGLGRWGLNAPVGPPVERKGSKRKQD